ncbi:hypothetical protein [Halorubellus salinus]|uniref:hypothetical protein n=1 Tax=Halorubellus salinus TaxID=755309 RepID=UPI001D0804BA|nr:hypothetical protein [Halorubellus salinus]
MRRWILALVVAVGVVVMLAPTGSVSVASIDRSIAFDVATNEDAHVSVWDPGGASPEPPKYAGEKPVVGGQDAVRLLVVRNGFTSGPVDVSVAHRAGSRVAVDGGTTGVAHGDVVPVRAAVDCRGRTGRVSVPVVLQVSAVHGDVETTIRMDVDVVCGSVTDHTDGERDAETASTTTGGNDSTTDGNDSTTDTDDSTTDADESTTAATGLTAPTVAVSRLETRPRRQLGRGAEPAIDHPNTAITVVQRLP